MKPIKPEIAGLVAIRRPCDRIWLNGYTAETAIYKKQECIKRQETGQGKCPMKKQLSCKEAFNKRFARWK